MQHVGYGKEREVRLGLLVRSGADEFLQRQFYADRNTADYTPIAIPLAIPIADYSLLY